MIGGLVALVACGSSESTSTGASGATTSASSTGGAGGTGGTGGGLAACGTAGTAFERGKLEVLEFDDGARASTLREQTFTIKKTPGQVSKDYVLNEVPVHEAVRFELTRPARVHGFEIAWALPDGTAPEVELEAGLYGDFGHNGFDFWKPDPLWTGTRCARDVAADGPLLTYAFTTPVEVTTPGLVYVAHLANPGAPVWWFDGTNADSCDAFDACQSAFNLPEADKTTYFNGLSFPFQRHFLVRLFVEYTDDVAPAERLFQPVKDAPTGGHVSWGDYDRDGRDDLLLGAQLWRNQGDGTFEDVSSVAGLTGLAATGGVFGDYDNDGCLDLFLYAESYSERDHLMRSRCDGTFEDVTLAAGLDDVQSYNSCGDPQKNTQTPSAAAAWLDLDADGDLDLYLANFICWSDGTNYTDTVFKNRGDGTFENVTAKLGFSSLKTPSRGAAPIDADRDGDVDLFVNNYRLIANLFFQNQGDGSVAEKAAALGLAGKKSKGYFGHTIGAAWGDLDNDGDFDLIAANLAHPRFFHFSDKTNVLLNDGAGLFVDIKGDFAKPESAAGLRYQETHSVPMLADFDQDGALDLVITATYDGRPTDFYWGKGDGHFALDSFHAGITTENGWGVAGSDFDNDGDVDVFASALFENEVPAVKKGHFLEVKVRGTKANREAIGATVEVKTGKTTRLRHVQGGTGKGGQDSLYLHFGLGTSTAVDAITVTYPGGKKQTIAGPIDVDRRVWITEDDAQPVFGWLPPDK
ncbi:MAG: CRTAC1 family protein [Deltaproteobacteria bacterium]|nr:CRTAC1 family protein [Deltaproteobacteria bacterium]